MPEEKKSFKVTIDNITVEVEPGTSILQAARKIGGDVVPPAMCYYSKLKGSGGKCRTCLVRVAAGSTADPRPMPKLVASCRTNVMDGMVVESMTNNTVLDARKAVVEFLLINHPLDCPVCDQAGECDLQDLSYDHGRESTRYEFKRRTFERHNLGPYIQLHMTRCILCFRCVYVADQLTNKRVHGILDRFGMRFLGSSIWGGANYVNVYIGLAAFFVTQSISMTPRLWAKLPYVILAVTAHG